ncbi:MAG: 2,3-dihydroxybiphenyl 1,2-dioxygenase [Candidatus Binatia bacterium]
MAGDASPRTVTDLEDIDMDVLGIAYLGFESPKSEEWQTFGPEVLGLELAPPVDGDRTVRLRMDDRRWRLAFHPGDSDRLAYVGWQVKSRPSFEDAVRALETKGVHVKRGDEKLAAERGVRDVAAFADPAGYRHELIYGQKFDPGSFIPGRPHRGFVGDNDGVGHVVIAVPSYDDALDRFWGETMGFVWFGSGAGGGKAGFYRAPLSNLSHSIGIVQVPGRFGIHHVGMAVRRIEDVGIVSDLCKKRGIPLQMTMGQHVQDPVVSTYLFTPSSFIIEYLSPVGKTESVEDFVEPNPEKLSIWGHEIVGPMMPETVRPVA